MATPSTGRPVPWSVPTDYLLRLRLDAALRALEGGEYTAALVEAEELLAEAPGHEPALGVVGTAALQLGNATLACEAFSLLLELRPDDAETHAVLAMARFGLADLHGALRSARSAVALRPDLPEAWYYAGLAEERLRRDTEAREAFARAEALAPDTYAEPDELADDLWQTALGTAATLLPAPLQRFYGDVPARWEDFPQMDELLAVDPPLSPFTDALYDGTPPVEGDPWSQRPGAIRLFRRNLARPSAGPDELAARIARALVHEALDWLGVSMEELDPSGPSLHG